MYYGHTNTSFGVEGTSLWRKFWVNRRWRVSCPTKPLEVPVGTSRHAVYAKNGEPIKKRNKL